MRYLGQRFEIGSHTIDHCYLNTVGVAEARRQIVAGKHRLEQVLARRVIGFCYPGGHYTLEHRQMVVDAGFDYARTVANFYRTLLTDPFSMPTTIQYYPHTRNVFITNFFNGGEWRRRSGLFCVSVAEGDLMSRLRRLLDYVCIRGGVFHLWGHSWELDRFDGWRQLDNFLRYAADRIPVERRLSNSEVRAGPV
jgi:peptidoglycan/xylan/chitin deacetylase (PgdA/CDA1 family)